MRYDLSNTLLREFRDDYLAIRRMARMAEDARLAYLKLARDLAGGHFDDLEFGDPGALSEVICLSDSS